MTGAIDIPDNRIIKGTSQATAVEQARAVAEVAAAVKVAQDCPRDITRAVDRMRQACRQTALAERAFWSLPRAGGRIEGSSVHLFRELALCWGNIDHGVRELRRDDEAHVSEILAWAWDQETNARSSRSFIVPHAHMVGKGADKKRVTFNDLADITNNNNSVGARAVRETIKHVLPTWFVSEAEDLCAKTLQDGGGKTLDQQVADAIAYYANTFNVTKAQLEERLDRKVKQWTAQDLGVLRIIGGELSRGEKRVQDEFTADQSGRITAADVVAETPDGATADDVPAPSGNEPSQDLLDEMTREQT